MTNREKLIALAALALMIAAGVVGAIALREHDARTRAEANDTAQRQVIAEAQKQIDSAKAQQAATAADLQRKLDVIAAQRQTVPTPQQFVLDVSKLMPALPKPVEVKDVAATATTPATQELVIPKEDIPAFQNYKLDCNEKSARLDACTLNTASLNTQLTATQTQLTATEKQRDSWKAAAKGGTLLQRLKQKSKCLALSAATSYLGARIDKQQPERGAVIGATAGGIGCELF
jgi:hypothetical protein